MRLAVMQPYIFPYIGYFQLVNTVDKFVFYDDVNFIKQGWINRNKIWVNNKEWTFTIPLENASSFKLINCTKINSRLYSTWVEKFKNTLKQNYRKSQYFESVMPIIENVIDNKFDTISELAIHSVTNVSKYLKINTEFLTSSIIFHDSQGLNRTERLIAISQKSNSHVYINPVGGEKLYSGNDFQKHNIELKFLTSKITATPEGMPQERSNLSIIDIMMCYSPEQIQQLLNKCEIQTAQ
jgi:hypothetical protein